MRGFRAGPGGPGGAAVRGGYDNCFGMHMHMHMLVLMLFYSWFASLASFAAAGAPVCGVFSSAVSRPLFCVS